mmetsp:Transcript_55397/g.113055  ORF Transcript_55397/g.113055 Transcript_55397/m.113055 type:complete len:81 (-) Transcript_55397:336-578(-)
MAFSLYEDQILWTIPSLVLSNTFRSRQDSNIFVFNRSLCSLCFDRKELMTSIANVIQLLSVRLRYIHTPFAVSNVDTGVV